MSRKKQAPKRIFYPESKYSSLVLAKFIMDLAFVRLSEDKLSDDEKIGYTNLSNTSLSNLFNNEFLQTLYAISSLES